MPRIFLFDRNFKQKIFANVIVTAAVRAFYAHIILAKRNGIIKSISRFCAVFIVNADKLDLGFATLNKRYFVSSANLFYRDLVAVLFDKLRYSCVYALAIGYNAALAGINQDVKRFYLIFSDKDAVAIVFRASANADGKRYYKQH